jgi:hypothetical protein
MTKTDRAFDQFWQQYPRKVGKLAARAQFERALKIASVEQIVAGVERYKRLKPAYADWCHPKTWLHQGRWMDEPDTPATVEQAETSEEWMRRIGWTAEDQNRGTVS